MNADFPTLKLEGLPDLDPYAYEEEVGDEGVMTISARVRVSPEVGETLKARWLETRGSDDDPGYFSVTRIGRDAEPRPMRFGLPFWSKHDDHEKHELTLVDRAHDKDEPQPRWPHGPEEMRQRANLIHVVEQMDALLKLLTERGVITEADAQGLSEISEESRWRRYLDFRRADDIDDWA